ncbi:MAG: YjbH domain-containing protein [Burkholderiales bacterium]
MAGDAVVRLGRVSGRAAAKVLACAAALGNTAVHAQMALKLATTLSAPRESVPSASASASASATANDSIVLAATTLGESVLLAATAPRESMPLATATPRERLLLAAAAPIEGIPLASGTARESIPLATTAPRAGERLSDWLLRQPDDQAAYVPGLHWQVPAERNTQAGMKRDLLVWLAVTETAPATARENLTQMLKALPATGRVPLPRTDARWLQARPKDDPILQRDHVLLLPRRPNTVSVLTNEGKYCTLMHRPGSEARDYVKTCEPESVDRVDRAWVVQPDGTVRNFGIARWNAQAQDAAAPGALIWAPSREKGWSPQFSTMLTQFLATQSYDAVVQGGASETSVVRGGAPASLVVPTTRARDAQVTANDWGVIGLLQTPTARMAEAGEARFHYSRVYPYERLNTLLQPLDWLEAGFRYTDIKNRLYGPAALSGDQTYKDKSVDFKVRLFKETAIWPQLAVGITDIGGTGLFSSEYLVANKRFGNFDWSLGIGWGNLGSSGNIRNPLSLLGPSFNTRTATNTNAATGGSVNSGSFFRGTSALFGGVQYHTPWDKWLFKAEYDGNNYQNEPQANNQTQKTPINFGVVYRYGAGLDISAAVERGNMLMLGLTFHAALNKLDAPKVSDAPTPRVVATRPTEEPNWAATAADLAAMSSWSIRQLGREGHALQVVIDGASGVYWNDRIERMTAVMHRDAPADIHEFQLIFIEQGIPLAERVILREPWVKQNIEFQAISDRFQTIAAAEPRGALPPATLWDPTRGRFGYSLVPSWQQNLGGPDGFILFSAGVTTPFRFVISEDTSITGALSLALLDNYDNFKYTAPSNLPRVRTFLREYTTSKGITLPNLQITHIGKLSANQYFSAYGGFLERMYAGVGGEWLYRPFHKPFAFGIDINRVQQRSFDQAFGFGNADTQTGYRVTTGHASAYWDTGWKSTNVRLSAGQYLAKDIGATLEVSRTFNNGVSIGAWATKTNISAATFGEGSFDKGIYLRIPFDVMTTSRGGGAANLVYNPLTRDGGARLSRQSSLYALTNSRGKRETGYAPAGTGGLDEDTPEWASERSLIADFFKTGLNLGGQVAEGQLSNALWLGGGIVVASSLLDRPVAKWADNHQSSRWNKLGKAANNVPLLLAAGTGMLWWGMGGDGASETAWTAIKSTAITLGADALLTRAVNRARPEANLGVANFDPFGKDASKGSFPSTHMGAAFALVTPFAQQYDAPWLYAVAGATSFGRIQQRQHFVSDVVAGSLLGYVAGSLLLDQQRKDRTGPKISIGSNRSITAAWEFN